MYKHSDTTEMILIDKKVLNAFIITSPLTVKDLKELGLIKKANKDKFGLDPKKGERRLLKVERGYTSSYIIN